MIEASYGLCNDIPGIYWQELAGTRDNEISKDFLALEDTGVSNYSNYKMQHVAQGQEIPGWNALLSIKLKCEHSSTAKVHAWNEDITWIIWLLCLGKYVWNQGMNTKRMV